jgi:hypothetical protein
MLGMDAVWAMTGWFSGVKHPIAALEAPGNFRPEGKNYAP